MSHYAYIPPFQETQSYITLMSPLNLMNSIKYPSKHIKTRSLLIYPINIQLLSGKLT